jgi:hypothetical protein
MATHPELLAALLLCDPLLPHEVRPSALARR